MAGIFPLETEMTPGLRGLGYREVLLKEDSPVATESESLRGHEFHYSRVINRADGLRNIYLVRDRWNDVVPTEGFLYRNSLGSYVHLHFLSNPWAVVKALQNYCP